MPTAESNTAALEVIAEAGKARTALLLSKRKLHNAKQDIIQQAGGRPPTPEQLSAVQEIDAQMAKMSDGIVALSLEDVEQLDQSSEVRDLSQTLGDVNNGLKSDLDAIRRVAGTLDEIDDAISTIDSVLSGLEKLLPLLV